MDRDLTDIIRENEEAEGEPKMVICNHADCDVSNRCPHSESHDPIGKCHIIEEYCNVGDYLVKCVEVSGNDM